MSGIMAVVSLDGRPVPPELARAQLAAVAHRGEWEPRLWEAPGVALGHVNLPRTPEAEREVLPMANRSGRYWLTWDGRLDNRDELGAKLGYDTAERAGRTDAEYVLDAFLKWGDDCVHHLVGDWAVVIWDNEARRLFCAKDPLGWRQLYYAERDGLLLVGSEPQQLFAGGWVPKAVNEEYVARFLGGALQEPGSTHYDGIAELRGGELAWAGAAGIRIQAHWTAPRKPASKYRRFEEYVEAFEALFEQALAARLRFEPSHRRPDERRSRFVVRDEPGGRAGPIGRGFHPVRAGLSLARRARVRAPRCGAVADPVARGRRHRVLVSEQRVASGRHV